MRTKKKLTYAIISDEGRAKTCIKEIELDLIDCKSKSMYAIHRVVVNQLNNKRQNSGSTKTRSEVRGGGKKPWKQKGTGRARVGSIRSPLWRGGGVVFGPSAKSKKKINKKEKKLALRIILDNKFKKTIAIEKITTDPCRPSTKSIIEEMKKYDLTISNKENTLIIVEKKTRNLYLSIRNLSNVELLAANHINTVSLLRAEQIIITENALNILEENI